MMGTLESQDRRATKKAEKRIHDLNPPKSRDIFQMFPVLPSTLVAEFKCKQDHLGMSCSALFLIAEHFIFRPPKDILHGIPIFKTHSISLIKGGLGNVKPGQPGLPASFFLLSAPIIAPRTLRRESVVPSENFIT